MLNRSVCICMGPKKSEWVLFRQLLKRRTIVWKQSLASLESVKGKRKTYMMFSSLEFWNPSYWRLLNWAHRHRWEKRLTCTLHSNWAIICNSHESYVHIPGHSRHKIEHMNETFRTAPCAAIALVRIDEAVADDDAALTLGGYYRPSVASPVLLSSGAAMRSRGATHSK
jgi:hypothetical protein